MSEVQSIAVPSRTNPRVVRRVTGADGEVASVPLAAPAAPAAEPAPAAAPAPVPDDSLTLKVCLYSGIDGVPILKLTYTPLASKDGERLRFTRHSLGNPPFVKEYEDCKVNTEMKICLALQKPTQVGLYYKGHAFMWKQKETLIQIKKDERDLLDVNDHNCEDDECDPDSHTVGVCDFWEFIQNKVYHILADAMKFDSKLLRAEEMLKDKECPVLLEPLKPGKSLKLSCGHFLSLEAWTKQSGMNCPMCRAPGNAGGNIEHL